MEYTPTAQTPNLINLIPIIFAGTLALFVFLVLGFLFLRYLTGFIKYRQREKASLQFILLQIKVPRGNEIKIDAQEQLFAPLSSLRKSGGFLSGFNLQPHLSFEIVAAHESIRFFVSCHKDHQDLVEKQIHGPYPQPQLKELANLQKLDPAEALVHHDLKLKNSN